MFYCNKSNLSRSTSGCSTCCSLSTSVGRCIRQILCSVSENNNQKRDKASGACNNSRTSLGLVHQSPHGDSHSRLVQPCMETPLLPPKLRHNPFERQRSPLPQHVLTLADGSHGVKELESGE